MFRSMKKMLAGMAALAALGLGGAAIAGAATSSTATTTTSTTQSAPSGRPPANFPTPGSAAHENAEKAVTGDAATKAQAAAVKSVGSGTAGAVTTDYAGHGYEVTVTKPDGSKVEVHLDSAFNVMQCPGGPGAPRPPGPPPGANGSSGAPSANSAPPAGSSGA